MADTPIPADVLDAARGLWWALEVSRADEQGEIAIISGALTADRAAQAERIRELERQLRGCTWYWPEDDTSSETCTESAQEVVQNAYDYKTPEGEVVAVARGGVVAVSYCAYLPPADDSDSDDDFWIEENTREAAKAKIDAELARRSALGGNNG